MRKHIVRISRIIQFSIWFCMAIFGIVTVLGFVLAFTIATDFTSGLWCVMGLSAFGILFFWLVSNFTNDEGVNGGSIAGRDKTQYAQILYHPTQIGDDLVRYALVQEGKRTLFVIGLNPSTADASTPDPTMQSVLRIAAHNGFDGFIMLNLYPARATQPYNLPKERDDALHELNLQKIRELLEGRTKVEVWLAFGANANRRSYLIPCFEDIVKVFEPYNPKWYYINELTKEGFPPHPLYQQIGNFKAYPMN